MGLFDFLNKNKFEKILKKTINDSALIFLLPLKMHPNGMDKMMQDPIKRRKMLFFLFGAIDCGLKKVSGQKLDGGLIKKEKDLSTHQLIFDYFTDTIGYDITEVMDIPIVLSNTPNKNNLLSYNPKEMFDLVVEGGNSFLNYFDAPDDSSRTRVQFYLTRILLDRDF